jgi:hypothetical protein
MRLLNVFAALLIASFGLAIHAQPSNAADSSPVKVVNDTKIYKVLIPNDLQWSSKSLNAATKAIAYQKNEIALALEKLAAKGAVTIVKKYVKTSSVAYPDWKSYVPTYNQYTLSGLSAKGKIIASSGKLPSDSANLANRLVYLVQTKCAPKELNPTDIETCAISEADPKLYLRAAMRTALGNGQTEDLGGYIYQQLLTCLKGKKPFTITDDYFDCPSNAAIFGGARGFNLHGNFASRSYSIEVNKLKFTATLTYGPLKYSEIANSAVYGSGSVIRFG